MSTSSAPEFEPIPPSDTTVAEYHSSRARYIRSVTADVEQRLMRTIGKRREPLRDEVNNLTELAHHRHDAYQQKLKEYAAKAPGRVTASGIQPPLPTHRAPGVGKLYKEALAAAADFREVDAIIKKRKEQLAQLDFKLRQQVEQYGRDLIAQLETKDGLESAFRRDPLLGRAHARMLAAQARRDAVLR